MNRPLTAYAVQDEITSPKWAMNFAKGCGGTAVPATNDMDLRPGDSAFFGSPQIWGLIQRAMNDPDRDWYYGDHAYFRRQRYFRITKNRIQHDGVPTPGRALSMDRLRSCGVEMHPTWKKEGSHVVVCPNSPVYMALFGIDAHQWAADITEKVMRLTDRPVIVRWKAQAAKRPLYVDLVDAWCTVVFSSNSAVESIAAGVPCITLADFAASRRMGRHQIEDIENPFYPDDRAEFLMTLAQNQFSFAEMADGTAWNLLRRDH